MDLEIELKNATAAEMETRAAINKLLLNYPITDWVFTRKVEVDCEAWPHSHPVLTLNTRLRNNELLLLSTFIHEQLHWFEEQHAGDRDLAIEETRRFYPDVPTSPPSGAGDETSTRLHLLVCCLEYRVMQRLVGDEKAREVMLALGDDHYAWIYSIVLQDAANIDRILRKYRLLPEGLR